VDVLPNAGVVVKPKADVDADVVGVDVLPNAGVVVKPKADVDAVVAGVDVLPNAGVVVSEPKADVVVVEVDEVPNEPKPPVEV